jgi:spore coat polysaccharide biosynthesis predicted glycosyltransferase SpsG
MNYIFVAFEGLKAGLGTGHIVRIKKVIDALRSSASSVESIIFISNISEQSSNYSLMRVHNLEDASDAILSCVRHKNIDLVVFDCLDYCEDVYAECSNQSIITVGIDTSSKQSVMLDILVNPVIENQLSHLRGPFYAIHQGGHYLQEQQICIESKKSIFICFGGIDYQNHFGGILPFISSLPGSYDINIVLASEDDFELAPPLRDNVNFFFDHLTFMIY